MITLLFVLVFALLVFGPTRALAFSQHAGRLLSQVKGATAGLKPQLQGEILDHRFFEPDTNFEDNTANR